jgi:hypothetical protein
MKHFAEIIARHNSVVRAFEAVNLVRPDTDPLYMNLAEAVSELEHATNEADFEVTAKKIRRTIALLCDVCNKEAERWAKWKLAYDALQMGVEDALEKDKAKL